MTRTKQLWLMGFLMADLGGAIYLAYRHYYPIPQEPPTTCDDGLPATIVEAPEPDGSTTIHMSCLPHRFRHYGPEVRS